MYKYEAWIDLLSTRVIKMAMADVKGKYFNTTYNTGVRFCTLFCCFWSRVMKVFFDKFQSTSSYLISSSSKCFLLKASLIRTGFGIMSVFAYTTPYDPFSFCQSYHTFMCLCIMLPHRRGVNYNKSQHLLTFLISINQIIPRVFWIGLSWKLESLVPSVCVCVWSCIGHWTVSE